LDPYATECIPQERRYLWGKKKELFSTHIHTVSVYSLYRQKRKIRPSAP
jgi:hypothetical protein